VNESVCDAAKKRKKKRISMVRLDKMPDKKGMRIIYFTVVAPRTSIRFPMITTTPSTAT
jgi:hypothetical protein